MRDLVAGERVALSGEVALRLSEPLRPPLGLALIGLDGRRKGVSAWPPIDSTARELRPGARFDEDGPVIMPADLPREVERLIVVAFLTTGPGGGRTFRDLGSLGIAAGDWRYRIDLVDRADTALVLVELYRHAGGWKLLADGGGFVHGLPALADAYGLDLGWAQRLGGARPREEQEGGPPRSGGGGGSGVAIDRRHIVTNAHVVEDARSITIAGDGRTVIAELVFTDARNDLALIRVEQPLSAIARFRAGLDLHLGEEVVALGFPLQGLLGSGPQASAGNIAGLCGLHNDSSTFQFSAPIASGNSGGPIFDGAGQIVGLVSSSLNLERIRATGNNAENVNFGIKGALMRSFLDAYGIQAELAEPAAPIARAAMVRAARETIFRLTVEC